MTELFDLSLQINWFYNCFLHIKYKDEVVTWVRNLKCLIPDVLMVVSSRAAPHCLQGEFPTSCHCGSKVSSQFFGPLPSRYPPVTLCRKTASNRLFIPSFCSPEGANSRRHFIRPSPDLLLLFPLHAKDTAKATAIVFKLFILSQDCVVIYNVHTENTL